MGERKRDETRRRPCRVDSRSFFGAHNTGIRWRSGSRCSWARSRCISWNRRGPTRFRSSSASPAFSSRHSRAAFSISLSPSSLCQKSAQHEARRTLGRSRATANVSFEKSARKSRVCPTTTSNNNKNNNKNNGGKCAPSDSLAHLDAGVLRLSSTAGDRARHRGEGAVGPPAAPREPAREPALSSQGEPVQVGGVLFFASDTRGPRAVCQHDGIFKAARSFSRGPRSGID